MTAIGISAFVWLMLASGLRMAGLTPLWSLSTMLLIAASCLAGLSLTLRR